MKKIVFAALPILGIAMLALKPIADPLPIGASIPNAQLKMKDISGTEVSFKDAQKKNGLLGNVQLQYLPGSKKYQSRTLEVAKCASGE